MRLRVIWLCMAAVLSLSWTGAAWATGCTADIANDDAQVNISDLLELLGNWGTDGPGSDIAEPNDTVNVSDLLGLLSQWGACPFPSCGNPDSGNCFLPNGTPGCQDEDCCKTVCESDSFCCDVEWDSLCVNEALDLCGNAACPGEGDCFSSNGTPGCNDEVCCNIVCSIDSFCCDTSWDGICAGEAQDNCPTEPEMGACCLPDGSCTDDVSPTACAEMGGTFQGDGSICDNVICPNPACPGEGNCFVANGTPGCEDEECCNLVCDSDPFCCDSSWDSLCAGTANDLCGNDACPGEGDCFSSNGTPGCEDEACCNTVCAIDSFCCNTSWDSLCAETAFANCTDCGDPDAGSCFESNGTPGCDDAECCASVCIEDAFCCETEWDSLCAGSAAEICANCGSPDAGDCFASNGTPGCEDLECCQTVCAIDAFCCESSWDSICAEEAFENCTDCGNPDAGSCFEANGTPGCDDADCCVSVCLQDAFCCETEWDSLCAGSAAEICANCGSPDAGDCFFANGTPGCEDLECCQAVCAADPFCCESQWDSICAGEANDLCGNAACPGDGDCFASNGSPGCQDESCCNTVCAIDAFCCDSSWDSICAEEAFANCTDCGDPDAGSCFEANGTPGCDDAECCASVCIDDAFCCETEWDSLCADAAAENPDCQ